MFPVYSNGITYLPGYSSTAHKVMGQDLPHVTLVFDIKSLSPAEEYVALSRAPSFDKVVPMLCLRKSHF